MLVVTYLISSPAKSYDSVMVCFDSKACTKQKWFQDYFTFQVRHPTLDFTCFFSSPSNFPEFLNIFPLV